jgi:hypothetical protein
MRGPVERCAGGKNATQGASGTAISRMCRPDLLDAFEWSRSSGPTLEREKIMRHGDLWRSSKAGRPMGIGLR